MFLFASGFILNSFFFFSLLLKTALKLFYVVHVKTDNQLILEELCSSLKYSKLSSKESIISGYCQAGVKQIRKPHILYHIKPLQRILHIEVISAGRTGSQFAYKLITPNFRSTTAVSGRSISIADKDLLCLKRLNFNFFLKQSLRKEIGTSRTRSTTMTRNLYIYFFHIRHIFNINKKYITVHACLFHSMGLFVADGYGICYDQLVRTLLKVAFSQTSD